MPIIINIMPKDINSEEYDAGTKMNLPEASLGVSIVLT
jgi:hypothetical protein